MIDPVPARPSFSTAVRVTFKAFGRHLATCLLLTAPFALLLAMPLSVVGAFTPEVNLLDLSGTEAFALGAFAIAAIGTFALVAVLVYPATTGALSLVGEATFTSESVEFRVISRRALDRALACSGAYLMVLLLVWAGPAMVTAILAFVGVATGTHAPYVALAVVASPLFAVALYVSVRTLLAIPAATTEELGPIEAIHRSWELTRGAFWWILGVFVVAGLGGAAVAAVLSVVAKLLSALGPAAFAFSLVRNVIVAVVSASLAGVASGVVYAARAVPARRQAGAEVARDDTPPRGVQIELTAEQPPTDATPRSPA